MEAVSRTTVTTTKHSTSGSTYHTPISQTRQIVIARSAHGQAPAGGGFRENYRKTYALSAGASSAMATSGVNNIVQGRTKEKKDMQELNQRFASYIEKVRFLEAQNRKLATELTGLREQWGKETEKVKALYEGELKQLRKLLDESERSKAELEVRITSLEDRISELQILIDEAREQESIDKETIQKLNQMIADYEGEITILRKRVSRFDDERARDKKEMERLRSEITRLRNDLDSETLAHINAENDCQTAREELEFQKQVHEAELKELAGLAYRDTTAENRDFWKAELSQAIHDIQSEYDNKLEVIKSDLEHMYSSKVSEFRTTNTRGNMEANHIKDENTRIKNQLANLRDRLPDLEARNAALENQIAELMRELEELRRDHELERTTLNKDLSETRAELAQVLDELQTLLDAKLSLELEIVAYRKLLECEEARTPKPESSKSDRKNLVLPPKDSSKMGAEPVESVIAPKTESGVKSAPTVNDTSKTESEHAESGLHSHGEMSAKTSYHRTSKGSVSIKEIAIDGSHLIIENTAARKDKPPPKQDIGGWSLKRDIDNGAQVIRFTLAPGTVLESDGSGKSLTIWAKGRRPKNSKDPEMFDAKSWGVGGTLAVTTLYNEKGEERATHQARTTFQASGHLVA